MSMVKCNVGEVSLDEAVEVSLEIMVGYVDARGNRRMKGERIRRRWNSEEDPCVR